MSTFTNASFEDNQRWYPWVETGLHSSSQQGRGEVNFFVPLQQTNRSMVFLDARNRFFSNAEIEGNYAIGYRKMFDQWNAGTWLSLDARRAESHNKFYQVAGGLEALHPDYDLRFNLYESLSKPKNSNYTAEYVITGDQIRMIGGREVPLSGFDYEAGVRLPVDDWFSSVSAKDATVRAYAGRFHFSDDEAFESVSGYRARLTWTQHDVLSDMLGADLLINAMYSHDDARGSIKEFGLTIKIPLGGHAPVRKLNWSTQRKRMAEGLVRDIDIVTGQSPEEPVKDAKTGVQIDRVVFTSSAAGLNAAIAQGAGTLIVAQSDGSAISGNFTLQASQTLLGGAGSLSLTGVSSGSTASYVAPGSRPTLSSAAGRILTMTTSNHVNGLNITGSGGAFLNGNIGIDTNNNESNMFVADVDFSGLRHAGLFVNTSATMTIEDVTVDNSFFGVLVNSGNRVTINDLTISSTTNDALSFNTNNTVVMSGVSFDSAGDDAISVDSTGNNITLSSATFNNIADDIWDVNNSNTITASNLTINNPGDDVFTIGSSNTIEFTDSTINSIGQEFFDMSTSNNITVADITLNGTAGSTLFHFVGAGNVVSNSTGNTNNLTGSPTLCDASGAGGFTGSIAFVDGTTLIDGDARCN